MATRAVEDDWETVEGGDEWETVGDTPHVDVRFAPFNPDPASYAPPMPPVTMDAPQEARTPAGFIGNVMTSGGQALKGLAGAPKLLYEGVAQPAHLGMKVMEGLKNVPSYVLERYGGIDKLQQTLYEDPVGAFMDLASLLGGAGDIVQGVGAVGKMGTVAKTGAALSKAGAMVDPLAQAGRGIVAGAGKIAASANVPETLYESALKPSYRGDFGEEIATQNVQTGLQERIPVTSAGRMQIRQTLDDLSAKIEAEVASIPTTSTTDPLDLATTAQTQARAPYAGGSSMAGDYQAIDDYLAGEFLRSHQNAMLPTEVQRLKQATQQANKKKYQKAGIQGPTVDAELAVASAARAKLEDLAPQLKALNERSSAVNKLKKDLRKAVREAPGVLDAFIDRGAVYGTALLGGAGYVAGGGPGAAAALALKYALQSPGFKSNLAIALEDASKLKLGQPGAIATVPTKTLVGANSITATNHQTGERLMLQNGQWVPIQ